MTTIVDLLRCDALENSVDDPRHHVLLLDSSPSLIHVQLIVLHQRTRLNATDGCASYVYSAFLPSWVAKLSTSHNWVG